MKTFKLVSLTILDNDHVDMQRQPITLRDGLIINREDEQNRWIIEAYVDQYYFAFFQNLYENKKDVLIEVKITKEENAPATFITSLIGVNRIGERMNVLFSGTIVDQHKELIKENLKTLIDQGYQGEALLQAFKEQIE